MKVVENKTFTGATIKVDDTRFIKCKFESCVLEYHGGPSPELLNCTPSFDTRWDFKDCAARTVHILAQLGLIRRDVLGGKTADKPPADSN